MPVDPDSVHSPSRQKNKLKTKADHLARLQKNSERRGAIFLAQVPSERTVGDAFRVMLEVFESEVNTRSEDRTCSPHLHRLKKLLEHHASTHSIESENEAEETLCQTSGRPDRDGTSTGEIEAALVACKDDPEHAVAVRRAHRVWSLVDATPLASPVHGVLALRGKSLVEGTLLSILHRHHDRLRSKHAQAFLHECCGLLPCGRLAMRLGLSEFAQVEGDIGMWRELNVLHHRIEEARRKASQHLERAGHGITRNRRWYWRGVLKSAIGRVKMFPVLKEELQPRMNWVRDTLFAFVAFLEALTKTHELCINMERTILLLFAPSLLRFVEDKKMILSAEKLIASPARSLLLKNSEEAVSRSLDEIQQELHRMLTMTAEEKAVLNQRHHPLNDSADRRREQFQSSGGAHAMEPLRDDLSEELFNTFAVPLVAHATFVPNALKEIQLILRYSPIVDSKLRNSGGLIVEPIIRRTVEVHETNPYATLTTGRQQFRQVEYTMCRLLQGKFCIGEGKGESLYEAIQMAAQQATSHYYLTGALNEKVYAASVSSSNSSGAATKVVDGVEIRPPVVEEEMQF